MKKYFYIQNRQSGKTTMGVYEYLKNPKDSIFIVKNNHIASYISEKYDFSFDERKNIVSIPMLEKFICSKSFNKVIIDEYLFFTLKERKMIYKIFPNLEDDSEIYIFSTPKKVYSINDIERVKGLKEYNQTPETNDEDLYYNFLTDNDVKIIHNRLYYNYLTEIQGLYYK